MNKIFDRKILVAFIYFTFHVMHTSASEVVDRLIVEVDRISYSQLHIEAYCLLTDALGGRTELRQPNKVNWNELRAQFVTDMIIDQEALRVGGYEASRKMIEQARTILDQKTQITPDLSSRLQRYELKGPNLERLLAQAIRVESYKRSKQRQASVPDDRRDAAIHISSKFSSWQRSLEQRAVVRFLEREYISLKVLNDHLN